MFLEYAFEHAEPTAWEYAKAAALGEAHIGMPLVVNSSGLLEKAAGTTKPTYISMMKGTVAAGDTIPVTPVHNGRVYVTKATATIASPVRGTKYTIAADGSGITATTASGIVALERWDGDSISAGDEVLVVL